MNQISENILFDYFDGKITTIQRKTIEEWLKNPENEEVFYQYLNQWEAKNPQYVVDIEEGFKKVNKKITEVNTASNLDSDENTTSSVRWQVYVRWVAAAMLVISVSWFSWINFSNPKEVSYENLVQQTKMLTGEIYEKENTSPESMLVQLPDGSTVVLQPKGKLSYSPTQYGKKNREVILSGEAFFEVQKNAKIPFLVFANEVITKVLGTSFTIKANPNSAKTEVIVKTGKVAVFTQADADKHTKINDSSLKGVILEPNQQISIDRTKQKISQPTSVVSDELVIPIQKLNFEFEDAPVVEVLEELKEAYNVRIIYDKDKLASCRLTAHLADEPLYEKIKLICFALEIEYEEIEGGILIKSNGCK